MNTAQLFFSTAAHYEYVAQVRLAMPEIFGEPTSVIKTYRALNHQTMLQVHEGTGLYRLRPAPTADKKHPEYGDWQRGFLGEQIKEN